MNVGDTVSSPELRWNRRFRADACRLSADVIQRVRRELQVPRRYGNRSATLAGTVAGGGNCLIFLNRQTEAILPAREQVRREHWRQGDTVRAVLIDIRETTKGPQLILSRVSPLFLKALFQLEVPEILQGIVEIRALAREPGSRSKIAVYSRDDHVDPVGACVGLKGSRVQAVVSELAGERIDIVQWTDEPKAFIERALSPADVYRIIVQDEETVGEKAATVVVAPDQLSLAIGRSGQNVRCASYGLPVDRRRRYIAREKSFCSWERDIFKPWPGAARRAEGEGALAGAAGIRPSGNAATGEPFLRRKLPTGEIGGSRVGRRLLAQAG